MPLIEKGFTYSEIQDSSIFELLSWLNSFSRKAEMEAARYWLDSERDKLKDKIKPPQLYDSKGNAIPIVPLAEKALYNDAERTFLESLEDKVNEKYLDK